MSLPLGSTEGSRVVHERIGKQLTGFEEPDIIYMKFDGDVTNDEVAAINGLHLEICKGRDRVFFLIDMENLETLSSSVRRSSIEALNQMPIQGLSIYKAPMTARVLAKLLITGMRLFGKNIPLQFSDTEAEAREWIAQRRGLAA